MENKKKLKIAIDLDGVLIDKPPLIPKWLIEWLFRGGTKNTLECRYPSLKIDQLLRKLSHIYFFRPVIKKNLFLLEEIAKNNSVYIVSARYSFLKRETEKLLKKRGINGFIKNVFLNFNDLKPHLFKEKILRKIKPNIFIDDDINIINYLQGKIPEIKYYHSNKNFSLEDILELK